MNSLRTQLQQQRGLYVVEFAIVAFIFLFMLFGVIEVSRLMYTWSALDAATQRGARVAAVCPMNDAAIAQIAVFGSAGNSNSALIPGVTASNIAVTYLAADGSVTADQGAVEFVQVGISNYTHQMLIPQLVAGFVNPSLLSPSFQTIRLAESLGFDPVTGTESC